MKVFDVVNSSPIVAELMKERINILSAYKLKKISEEINIISSEFEKKRIQLLEEYGTLSEDNTKYDFPDDNGETFKKYNDDIKGYLEEEVEIDFKPLKISELYGVEIDAEKLNVISWIIDFSEILE